MEVQYVDFTEAKEMDGFKINFGKLQGLNCAWRESDPFFFFVRRDMVELEEIILKTIEYVKTKNHVFSEERQ